MQPQFTRVYAVLLNVDELEEVKATLLPSKMNWEVTSQTHPGLTALRKIDEALNRVGEPQVRG